MNRMIAAGLAALAAIPLLAVSAGAQALQDETRDRVLLIHQSRGTLAPGTRPKCFPSNVDDTVARSQYRCPWEGPNGRPNYPTARSLWGLFGDY